MMEWRAIWMKDTFDFVHIHSDFSFIRVKLWSEVHLEDEVNGTQQVRSE